MMSYWVWLTRLGFLGLVSSASLLFFLGATPKQSQQNNSQTSGVVQAIAPDPEYVFSVGLPNDAAAKDYTPTSGSNGGEMPASRLDPLLNYSDYEERAENNSSTPSEAESGSNSQAAPPKQTSSEPSPKSQSSPTTNPSPQKQASQHPKPAPAPFNLQQSIANHSKLFAEPTALGMLAIGAAEGNFRLFVEGNTLYVEQTPNYFGHTDPGNLSWGERVTNYGPCSDQGRSGGNIQLAEKLCSQRAIGRLSVNIQDLYNAGIHPDQNLEALINTADLYNQASPIHSRVFPQALAIARKGGLKGIDAIAWARTASFYLNSNNQLDLERGRNKATGLLGICARERRAVTEWDCVYQDQMRRTKEISGVLEKYIQVYGG